MNTACLDDDTGTNHDCGLLRLCSPTFPSAASTQWLLRPSYVWIANPSILMYIIICAPICLMPKANPHQVIKLPVTIFNDRYLLGRFSTERFSRSATLFEDAVTRCVHYGFTNIKPPIARIFFVKGVSWPFLRYRMLKHGYLFLPVHLEDIEQVGWSLIEMYCY